MKALTDLHNLFKRQQMSALNDASEYRAKGQPENAKYMSGEANAMKFAAEYVKEILTDLKQV